MSSSPFDITPSSTKLRKCQAEAYKAILKHYSGKRAERTTLIQLPTGTGKTALIAVAPFRLAKKRVLILTPNLKLARDVADKLDLLEAPESNVYKSFDILPEKLRNSIKLFVLRLEKKADANDIDEHHLIVANYHQLHDIEKWFSGNEDAIDLIIIDEAHHQAANTYQEVIQFFPSAKIIGLTATPFRSDGKPIEGKSIYKYSFTQAIKDGIIRNLLASNVAPEQIELEFVDDEKRTYTLGDVLKLKEKSWFRRGIALSQDCSDSIARRAHVKLSDLRAKFPSESHQIIAAAISKRHAREIVKPAFEKLGLHVAMVSSDPEDQKKNEGVFAKLAQGKLDVIIHIGMLGEGFDHPPLGVAAIFRPFATLNPYIQFIGRVIRKNGSTTHSHIVSHLGLNQLKRFEEFKMFDNDDQQLLEELMSGAVEFGDTTGDSAFLGGSNGNGNTTPDSELPTIREIGEQTMDFAAKFAPDSDMRKALSAFEQLGEEERKQFLEALGIDSTTVSLETFDKDRRTKPLAKRLAEKNKLNEKEKSITYDILNALGVEAKGKNFTYKFENFAWVKIRVSKILNRKMGITKGKRNKISNQQFDQMEEDGILDQVKAEALAHLSDKVKK